MSLLLNVPDFIVIGCMLAVSASVGLWFRFTGGRQKTTQEFLMAGKDMNVFPVAFSLMATFMSAISLLGVPSETYMYGTQNAFWMVGIPIGAVIAAYGFLPIFFDLGAMTAYEYLEKRFGKTTRTIAAFLFIIQMMLYMAVVLYAPSLALNAVTGLSTWTSVISLAAVCTFYCSLGGLKAVLWTDVFQSFLMYVTIIAVVLSAYLDYGFHEINKIVDEGGRFIFFNTTFDLTERYTLWNAVFNGLNFSLHTFGTNQAQIQRLLSVGNLKKAQRALLISLPLILIYNTFNYWDGVVIYGMFHDCDPMLDNRTHLSSPDQLMPYAIVKMFGGTPGLSGLCIAGVFSASLSTISSAMNSLTAVTIEDFIRPYCFCKKLTETWAAFLAKIIAVGYGVITLLLVFIVANFRGVIEASNIMFGMIGGPVLALYTLGMFFTFTNEPGSIIGLIAGLILNAWLGFGSYLAKPHIQSLSRSTEGCTRLLNDTLVQKVNSTLQSAALSASDSLLEEDRYILPVYKVSFVWYPLVGFTTVVVVGAIASYILKFWVVSSTSPKYISPFVRKLYFDCKTIEEEKSIQSIELKITNTTDVHSNEETSAALKGIVNRSIRES